MRNELARLVPITVQQASLSCTRLIPWHVHNKMKLAPVSVARTAITRWIKTGVLSVVDGVIVSVNPRDSRTREDAWARLIQVWMAGQGHLVKEVEGFTAGTVRVYFHFAIRLGWVEITGTVRSIKDSRWVGPENPDYRDLLSYRASLDQEKSSNKQTRS